MSDSQFASPEDVQAWLGSDELSAAQTAQVNLFLTLSTAAIAAAVDQDDDWATALTPVPTMLRALCAEITVRVMSNPAGARSETEQLGAYQHSQSFSDDAAGIQLTKDEELRARRLVYGTNSASAQATSILDDIADVVSVPGSEPVTYE